MIKLPQNRSTVRKIGIVPYVDHNVVFLIIICEDERSTVFSLFRFKCMRL